VKVEEDRIFIIDGPVWTSAGMTAGIDLALAMIEKDLGADVARAVARKLVVYHRRAGGQSQFSALLELEPKSDRIQSALAYAKRNLDKPLTVGQLAEAAHLSPRQFSRAFRAETGQSPAKAVENLRVEAARLMMEQSAIRSTSSLGKRVSPIAIACAAPSCALRTAAAGDPAKCACGSSGLNYGSLRQRSFSLTPRSRNENALPSRCHRLRSYCPVVSSPRRPPWSL